jgi:hypothetical protein
MNPCSPVMPGSGPIEVVYAKDQSEYAPLPALWIDGENSHTVVSRWRLTDEEREAIAAGADVVLQLLMAHGQLLTPSNLQVVMPDDSPALIEGF